MKSTALFLALALLPFAGCLGVPEDAVAFGDSVQIRYVAVDADTGLLAHSLLDNIPTTEDPFGREVWDNVTLRQQLTSIVGPLPGSLETLLSTTATIPKNVALARIQELGIEDTFATPAQFQIGSGASGLGSSFERSLTGYAIGESFDYAPRAPVLEFSGRVEREGVFGPVPTEGELETAQFSASFGDVAVGEEFTPPGSFYTYKLVAQDPNTTTYQVLPVDGQRDPVPQVGSDLITTLNEDGESMTQTLDPILGATFRIAPPSPFNPQTPLDLEPGSYRIIEDAPGSIVAEFSPSQLTHLIGARVQVIGTIVDVDKAEVAAAQPVDGNYGVRQSPQVLGQPSAHPDFGGGMVAPKHDDAMDHSDHE